MNKFEEVLNSLDKVGIKYDAITGNGIDSSHALVDVDSEYNIEIVDHKNEVEVYVFEMGYDYANEYDEITYFKRNYKTVNGAVKRVVELHNELN